MLWERFQLFFFFQNFRTFTWMLERVWAGPTAGLICFLFCAKFPICWITASCPTAFPETNGMRRWSFSSKSRKTREDRTILRREKIMTTKRETAVALRSSFCNRILKPCNLVFQRLQGPFEITDVREKFAQVVYSCCCMTLAVVPLHI